MPGLNISLTPPQSKFFTSEAKHTALVSGFGAGKTTTLLIKAIYTLIRHRQNIAIYEPSINLITKIVIPNIIGSLEEIGLPYSINKNEGVIRTSVGDIYLVSMSNPDRIIGYECIASFLDEFDVLPTSLAISVYHKIVARARLHSNNQNYKGKDCNQTFVASTPEGFKGLYQLFKKDPLDDSALIKMSTYSNPHLGPNYVKTLAAQYPDELLRAYLLGEFVNLNAGSVYTSFKRDLFVRQQIAPSKTEDIHVGMDFNVLHGAAAIFVRRYDTENEPVWLLVDEITKGRDTADVISKLQERYVRNRIIVYPDATGKRTQSSSMSRSDHGMLISAGFLLQVNSLNPLIKDRVTSVNNAFEKQKLYVCEGCISSIEALEQQVYDKDGKPSDDNGLDHILDAIGYFISYVMPIMSNEMRYDYIRHA